MAQNLLLCLAVSLMVLGGCTRNLNSEELAQVGLLKTELEVTKKEVAAAELKDAKYSGGLIKELVAMRLEILKINESLIQQRINAIESGTRITINTITAKVDLDRAKQLEAELIKQELKVSESETKASVGNGGLIGVMAEVGASTERNSLAMLRQQYLVSKYGLYLPQRNSNSTAASASVAKTSADVVEATTSAGKSKELREQILDVTLLKKSFSNQDYQDFVSMDIVFVARGLDKPTRAIKGTLILMDLFGEKKFGLKWTIEKPLNPGGTYNEKGSGFKYNQFTDSHQWVRSTDRDNMKLKFIVDSILYEDGILKDFN